MDALRIVVSSLSLKLKGGSFCWLSKSSVLIRTHFCANRLQDLLNPHVSIPIAHGRNLLLVDHTRLGIDGRHVNFRDETHFRRDRWVLFGAVNSQLVEATVMVSL